MPRKKKEAEAQVPVVPVVSVVEPTVEKRSIADNVRIRKPYPSRQERIALADDEILHWERLNAERRELIEKTEKQLADRKEALSKGEAILEKSRYKRDRLIANLDKTPAQARSENKQYQQVLAALQASGMSPTEILDKIRQL